MWFAFSFYKKWVKRLSNFSLEKRKVEIEMSIYQIDHKKIIELSKEISETKAAITKEFSTVLTTNFYSNIGTFFQYLKPTFQRLFCLN